MRQEKNSPTHPNNHGESMAMARVENFGGNGRFHPMTDIWDGDMSLGVIFGEESI